MTPQLSICIPTHNGRDETLEQALDSIRSQLSGSPSGAVEICISDGGSEDGTQAMVLRAQRHFGSTLKYEHHAVDGGFPEHLVRAVGMASGRYCWLFSSDDAIAAGGVETVRRALDAEPDLLGLTCAFATYDQKLLGRLAGAASADARYFPPRWWEAERFGERRQIAEALGVVFAYLGSQVVRRDAWLAALATVQRRGGPHSRPFPHIEVFSRMLDADGGWAWIPNQVVMKRSDNDSWTPRVFDGNSARYWIEILNQLQGLYRDLSGGDADVCRHLMTRWQRNVALPGHLLAYRHAYGSTWRGWAEMVYGYTRALWRSPEYWLWSLPVLLVPPPLLSLLR